MMSCGVCKESITARKKDSISCDFCGLHFHAACINFKTALIASIGDCSYGSLNYRCRDCIKSCVIIQNTQLTDLIEARVKEALTSLTTAFAELKADVLNRLPEKPKETPKETPENNDHQLVTYSDIVKNKTQPAIVIRPKDVNQI